MVCGGGPSSAAGPGCCQLLWTQRWRLRHWGRWGWSTKKKINIQQSHMLSESVGLWTDLCKKRWTVTVTASLPFRHRRLRVLPPSNHHNQCIKHSKRPKRRRLLDHRYIFFTNFISFSIILTTFLGTIYLWWRDDRTTGGKETTGRQDGRDRERGGRRQQQTCPSQLALLQAYLIFSGCFVQIVLVYTFLYHLYISFWTCVSLHLVIMKLKGDSSIKKGKSISDQVNMCFDDDCFQVTTKDLKVRKTNLLTERPKSLMTYIKDSRPKTETLKDLLHKDIALRDVVPWDKDAKDHPHIFLMYYCSN